MKFKLILISVFFVKSLIIHAQKTIDLENIDAIIYSENNPSIWFLEKNEENEYRKLIPYFNRDYKTKQIKFKIFNRTNAFKKLEDVLSQKEKMIPIEDIDEIEFNDIIKNKWKVIEGNKPWFKRNSDNTDFVLQFLNKNIAVVHQFYLGKKEANHGIGTIHTNYADNYVKRWRAETSEFYTTVAINLGDNKYVYLFLKGDDVKYSVIPNKKDIYIKAKNQNLCKVLADSQYKLSNRETFKYFNYKDFNVVKKNGLNQYNLITPFNEKILEESYDTILQNNYFTIGKLQNKITVLDAYHKEIVLENIKSAYPYRTGFEVIDNKGARYFNSELNVVTQFPERTYSVCGTVRVSEYQINFDKKTASYQIIIGDGYTSVDFKEKCHLGGLLKNDEVTFLDGSTKFRWDGNSNFIGEKNILPTYLKIKRDNQYGIYAYDYKKCKIFDPILEKMEQDMGIIKRKKPKTVIKPKVIMPIAYDAIDLKKDGLIYFYKKNKVGIYPRDKNVIYDTLEQKTKSFYKIIREGKKGWLDIKTNKEYYD